jgi:hypothetical protein
MTDTNQESKQFILPHDDDLSKKNSEQDLEKTNDEVYRNKDEASSKQKVTELQTSV